MMASEGRSTTVSNPFTPQTRDTPTAQALREADPPTSARDDADGSAGARSPESALESPLASVLAGLRPLTGYEEEYLDGRAGEANTAALCNEILARCLVPPGQDPGSRRDAVGALLVAERDRALIALRRMSLGDDVATELTCPTCERASVITFRLSDLPVDFAPPPRVLDVALDDGDTARVRMPTAADQAALLDEDLDTAARRRTWLLARLIVAMGDRAIPLTLDQVRAMNSSDRRHIERAVNQAEPDLDLAMDVVCSECGAEFSAPLDMAAFFLLS